MMRVHGGRGGGLLTRTTSTVILGSRRGIQLVFWIVRMSSLSRLLTKNWQEISMFRTYHTFDLLDDILIADLEAEKMHDLMVRITEGGGRGEEKEGKAAGLLRLKSRKRRRNGTDTTPYHRRKVGASGGQGNPD